jgi:LmbE family N-acetylglucosaminyl deacetylase
VDETKFFIPDNVSVKLALQRSTHIGIVAHQDDLEILALHGILKGLKNPCFGGIVLGDGKGSPRGGRFKDLDDQQMAAIRYKEQLKASRLGNYSFVAQLKYPSTTIKTASNAHVIEDELVSILKNSHPKAIYTHAPTDKHDTHVATLSCVLKALQKLPREKRPSSVLGCEVWRDLDWVPESELVVLDVSGHEALAAGLLGCFESQLVDGKRYDLAAIGRRRAQATFRNSSQTDSMSSAILALELAPFIDTPKNVLTYIERLHSDFQKDTANRLMRFL